MQRLAVLGVFCLTLQAQAPPEPELGELLLGDLRHGVGVKRVLQYAQTSIKVQPGHLTQSLAAKSLAHPERDLHRWARRHSWSNLLPHPYEFKLNLIDHSLTDDGLDKQARETTHAALLPHEVFHCIYSHGPELFTKLFLGGSENNLATWWREAAAIADEWYTEHPVIHRVAASLRVPFGVHGDDAGVHGQEQVLVLNWGSVVSVLPTLDSRIVFTMVKTRDILAGPEGTMQTLYGILTWSLNALSSGYFPDVDHNGHAFTDKWRRDRAGQRLAGGYVGCFAELRGDWKWLKEALYLQHHYGLDTLICHKCRVQKFGSVGMRYSNFKQSAKHRETLHAHREWMSMYTAAAIVSPLLFILGFHVSRVLFDILHCLDLGVYQVAVPSAMKELTARKDVWPGNTIAARFKAASTDYKIWRKQKRIKSYTPKPFVAKAWLKHKPPRVTQLTIKGAALRNMVTWIATVCNEHASDDHGKLRAYMFNNFVEADRVCRSAGRHLTPQQHKQLNTALENALQAYNALAAESVIAKTKLWKLLPKHHAITHVYDVPINPRRTACNQDEEFVGLCKKVYVSCHGTTAPIRCLQRLSIALCLRWWQLLSSLRFDVQ